ncbi:MAG: serine/threonine-protein kinase [Cyanobacteria bacterium P01_F01_bin.86]
MEGQLLQDRYRIKQSLGQNTHRISQQTFLAIDEVTNQPVAIKILRFGSDFEWEHLKLFEREAAILQALNHPAIPRYLDSFDLDAPDCRGFALVQTYIEAQSLEEHLQQGRAFATAEVVEIACQLLRILTYLHSHNPPIIHRDIKPSNVLLRDRTAHSVGTIHLVDFGSVQSLVAIEGGTITVVGTYGYMPPEQFGGRAVPASDLYSLGATIIYLLTGTHPANLPQRDLRIRFEDSVSLDDSFKHWLRQLIEPSLEKRFPDAATTLKALLEPRQWEQSLIHQQGRPAGSSIRLKTGFERLKLSIPSPRLSRGVRRPPLSGWGCLIAMMLWWLWAAWLGVSWGSHILLGLVSLFLEKQITINQASISLQYRLFSLLPIFQKEVDRSQICLLEIVDDVRQKSKWGEQEIKGEIIIWAGNYAFHINKLGGLTPPETAWLSEELGDWLGLQPLTRRVSRMDASSQNSDPSDS